MKKAKKSSIGKRVAIGTGLAAGVAAAAAGVYFLYGSKNAAKNRKQVKSWSLKARAEVLERLEKLSEINQKAYNQIIKEVSARYQRVKHLSSKEVGAFGTELKKHWKDIAKDMRASARAPRAANRKKKR